MKLFARLFKVDEARQEVTGRIAREEPDAAQEIMDYETSKPLFRAWSESFHKATGGQSKGNVRAMHGKVAAGKLTDISFDDEQKAVDVVAKIVDSAEWQKCLQGVYTGFSIGGSYAKRWEDGELMRYTAKPSEVSLVDNPCIKSARFSLVKADGSTVEKDFKEVAPAKAEILTNLKKWAGQEVMDAQTAISALYSIYYLYVSEMTEPEAEAGQVADLKEVINRLKSFIASEVMEPGDLAMAAKAGGLAKAGARNSKSDLERVQGIHDHAVGLGAVCGAAKTEKNTMDKEIQERFEKLEAAQEVLTKDNVELKASLEKSETEKAELAKANEALGKEKAELLKKAAPAKGMTKTMPVSKDADADKELAKSFEPIKKADGSIDQEATALELIKLAQGNPQILHGVTKG